MADKKISALTAATTPLAGTEVLPIVQGGATVKVSVANLTAGRTTSASNMLISDQTAVGTASPAAGTLLTLQESASLGAAIQMANRNSTQAWKIAVDAAAVDDKLLSIIDSTNGLVISTIAPSSGNVTLSLGNLVIGTSGKGIDFSATAGTGTSELLADYEEGTWTPTVSGLTVVGTPTYTGRYTKIGRLVTFDLQIESTTSTTATYPTTTFTLPFNQAGAPRSVALVSSGGVAQILTLYIYAPNWTAEQFVWISGSYSV